MPQPLRFLTRSGVEVHPVTEAEMRELDRVAIEETGPNLFQMMENAGRNLAQLALQDLGQDARGTRVVVLAGVGGNGGGGICAARHLANRGVDVRLCLPDPEGLREIPAYQLKIFESTAGRRVRPDELWEEPTDLVLDALLGYSASGPPRGTVGELIDWANESRSRVLSLDLPSGVEATGGRTPGAHVIPRWTLTLALPKTGLRPELSGEVFLADLGIPAGAFQRAGIPYTSPFDDDSILPLDCIDR